LKVPKAWKYAICAYLIPLIPLLVGDHSRLSSHPLAFQCYQIWTCRSQSHGNVVVVHSNCFGSAP
jgi:hypothetical protein